MNKIPLELRKKLFDALSSYSSPAFIEYLRVYEGLPKPPQESFEVSCELVNGVRVDSMRMAILGLRRQDVLRWLSACGINIPLIQDLLFENTTDECFGIGLADYLSGRGLCRIKIYNEYQDLQSQARTVAHIQRLFSILNIPDTGFRKDLERFKSIRIAGIDWDGEDQAAIKVYFGFFPPEQVFGGFSDVLLKEDLICYNNYRKYGFFPEKIQFPVKYSREGRCLKTEMHFQKIRVIPFLKLFDRQREVSKFFAGFYQKFPSMVLHVICMQWAPVERMQFYFMLGTDPAGSHE